ncbi:hypothetical protein LTR95_014769 [Oleoguttula sp. CCFEE 5521]
MAGIMQSHEVYAPGTHKLLPGLERHLKHYWSVPTYSLHSARNAIRLLTLRAYKVPTITNIQTLHDMLDRSERNLVYYPMCSSDALVAFVLARHLTTGAAITSHTRHAMLEGLLLDADARPVFDRFLFLPAEIRQQIFHYYFADLRDRIVNFWEYSDGGDHTMFSSPYIRRSRVKLAN